jgi:hypothetical protein
MIEPAAPCFVEVPDDTARKILRDCGHVVASENPATTDGRSVRLGYLRLGVASGTATRPLLMLARGAGKRC